MASRSMNKDAPEWRESMKRSAERTGVLLGGAAIIVLTLLLVIALLSYRPSDPSLMTAAEGPARNFVGAAGAWTADILLSFFGPAIGLIVPLLIVFGTRMLRGVPIGRWRRRTLGALGGIILIGASLAVFRGNALPYLPGGFGGAFGIGIASGFDWLLALLGDETVRSWVRAAILVTLAGSGIVLWAKCLGLDDEERAWLFRRRGKSASPQAADDDAYYFDEEDDEIVPEAPRRAAPEPRPEQAAEERRAPVISLPESKTLPADRAKTGPAEQTAFDLHDRYALPSTSLLHPAPANSGQTVDKSSLERNARLLETVLDDFHVKGSIVEVRPGPVVTMYELEPAAGIKASRVIQLADDIARNMSALSARVATIPGRSVIGIELPNKNRESVSFHELVTSQAFADQGGQLPLILGKNIAGDPVIADLAPMPHLLVAGTTGSGKSVGLNCMILSLLYRLSPDQCRMIMIDPKQLELSIYDGIPHLLSPVVTDPAKSVRALKWAVEQMEERYRMMASVGVRSLAGFNDKVNGARQKGQKLGRRVQTGYDGDTGQPIYEEEELDYHALPQIVIVVDELADLMMTAGKEVEFLIQRLAQKARAAGIHLIMATQRPSVDVITGVIKANLPTRISFAVTSKIDSRTILGEQGAEQLLGKGDMLYMPGGKQIARVHGPFVSDEEVGRIADHWRTQGAPEYIQAVTEEPEDGGYALDGAPSGDDSPEDQLYRKACQLVAESQKASTSWLQRQLRIGYNSAARLIERMEKEGLVSRPDHVGRREVLMDTDGRPV
ncbi:FtsK/SpoIIIE family DNA translocase [Sphingomonas sp. C3-2]|uniref:FtsK/SpoIIIE family DNA translocase n=1 Tax=Sphingomonas sp. C3-2 TaxID=3062169 RepID=UPI00294AA975|nr:DNA translocase FtsK 4TM domain-containing protein [Sphingomonas sp. C3-2]WOK35152.1 DNA translocase FtsK 4TM domain-containing protein [Sphingomonas sp. C3-2]